MKPETYTQLDRLLRKIESVCTSWGFFPECDFGSRDAIISTSQMIELENEYKSFCKAYGIEVEPQSNRAKAFNQFADKVINHIDGYTVPQYGDSPNDNVESWNSEDCYKQAEKYIKRRNTSRRPDEKKLDILKAVHYLQLAAEKMEAE